MLENSDDLMSIVVLEAGAAWPAWLTDYQRLAPNAVVIAQAAAESAELFQARVLHRVEDATGPTRSARVRVGIIVAADHQAQVRGALRENVARCLIKGMDTLEEGELVLAGDCSELEESRHELFALAGVLCEELSGKRVTVRVRFSSGQSGVMRTAVSASSERAPSASKA